MTRVSIRAALLLSAVALWATPTAAADEKPETPRPRLELISDVRIGVEDGADTNLLAVMSPSGRHMLVCYEPRAVPGRDCDTWTTLSLIDLGKAETTGSWGSQKMGRHPPAFSPNGTLFAWGSRKDAKTLKVNIYAAATRQGIGFDVPHREGLRGLAEVCGVSGNSQRIAIREPEDAEGRRHLIVVEPPGGDTIARFADFAEPYGAKVGAGVTLTGPRIAFHTRSGDESDEGGHRLQVMELNTSRVLTERTAFASRATSRYALAVAGGVLINGTKDFQVELVNLASGEARTLIDASDLYSHYLEVVLSADNKRVVAWSDERKLILARDIEGGKPIRVELPYRAHVLGISSDGRWAYVRVHDRGLVAVDIDTGKEAGVLATGMTEGLSDWVRITPDGAYLVEGVRDDEGWTFAIFAIETP